MRTETRRQAAAVHPSWARLSAGWPVECGVAWMTAEAGRVSADQYVTVVSDDRGPVAGAAWMLLTGAEERHGYNTVDLLSAESPELAATLPGPELLPCASAVLPGSYEPSLLWDLRRPAGETSLGLRQLVVAVTADASRLGARSVSFGAVPGNSHWSEARRCLSDCEYLPVAQPPATELAVPSGGIEDYLAALPGRRRKKVQREIRCFAGEVRVTEHGPDRLLDDDLAALVLARYRRYGHETSLRSVRDRMERARHLPGITLIAAYRGERLHGFKAFAVDRELGRIVSRFGGCEPDSFFGYFNLTYYEPIRYGAANGLRLMTLGTEAYDAKLHRGAVFKPLDAFVLPLDRRLDDSVRRAGVIRAKDEQERLTRLHSAAAADERS